MQYLLLIYWNEAAAEKMDAAARQEMSAQRMRDWMRENPEAAEEVRRGNRNFVFFRIVGLSEERDGPGREWPIATFATRGCCNTSGAEWRRRRS